MLLLIPNNVVRISIYMYYYNIRTQAIVVIRSTTYMLTLYCILNVICIIYYSILSVLIVVQLMVVVSIWILPWGRMNNYIH